MLLGKDIWLYELAYRVLRVRAGILDVEANYKELITLIKIDFPRLFKHIESLEEYIVKQERLLQEVAARAAAKEREHNAALNLNVAAPTRIMGQGLVSPHKIVLPKTIGEMSQKAVAELIQPGKTESMVGPYGRAGGPRMAEVQQNIDEERKREEKTCAETTLVACCNKPKET